MVAYGSENRTDENSPTHRCRVVRRGDVPAGSGERLRPLHRDSRQLGHPDRREREAARRITGVAGRTRAGHFDRSSGRRGPVPALPGDGCHKALRRADRGCELGTRSTEGLRCVGDPRCNLGRPGERGRESSAVWCASSPGPATRSSPGSGPVWASWSSTREHSGDERYITPDGYRSSPIYSATAAQVPWGDLIVHNLNNRYEFRAFAEDGTVARIVRRDHVPRSPTREDIEAYIVGTGLLVSRGSDPERG